MTFQADVDVDQLEGKFVARMPPIFGINQKVGPRWIGDNQAVEVYNGDLDDPSRPARRAGYRDTYIGSTGLSASNLRLILLAYFDVGAGSRLIVTGAEAGGTYITTSLDSASGWTEATTAGGASLNLNIDTPYAFQSNDLLWIVPGGGTPVHALKVDGTLIDTGNLNGSPPLAPADGTHFLERVWFLDDDRLYWSKLLPVAGDLTPTPSAFVRDNSGSGTAGGFLTLSPGKGAAAVAVRQWRQESLICFFKNQIEEVVVSSSNPLNSTRRQIESRIGCGSRDSIVQIGDEMYFLDQHGEYRALRINQLGSLQGIVPDPLSEVVADELHANLNKTYMRRVRASYLDGRIYLFYPRGTAQWPSHCLVLDISQKDQGPLWYGPWEFARPLTAPLVSDIRGGAQEMFVTDAGSTPERSAVYDFLKGTTDNGTAIVFRMTLRADTGGSREGDKQANYVDLEFGGDKDVTAEVLLRSNEKDSFTSVVQKAIEEVGDSDYPITYAVTYPIDDSVAKVPTTAKVVVSEAYAGDFPLYPSDFPLTAEDFPLYGAGGGPARGRIVQAQVKCSTGGAFQVIGLSVAGLMHNAQRDVEP